MRVSILIPIYGVEAYIEKCAESLFRQTYCDIEYVFVNDCTPDDSIAILRNVASKYPHRQKNMRIVTHEENSGLAVSRLTGLAYATGEFIMFVDSDDYLELNAVEQLASIAENEGSDIVSGGFYHEFTGGKRLYESPPSISKEEYLTLILKRQVKCNIWGRLYRRTLFNKGITFIKGINNGEDYVVVSRLFYFANKISNVNTPVVHYLHLNKGAYSAKYSRSNLDQVLKAETVISEFYKQIGDKELIVSHNIGNLKLKAEQIIILLRSKDRNKADYSYLLGLFDDCEKDNCLLKELAFQDRTLLKLSKVLNYNFMCLYVISGYFFKQLLKFK